MTGDCVIEKATQMLGYDNDARYQLNYLSALNTAYSDLFYLNHEDGFEPLKSTNEEIKLSERVLNDVMPYGVAAFIAQAMGDTDNQQFFSQMYNLKRKRASAQGTLEDVLPTV